MFRKIAVTALVVGLALPGVSQAAKVKIGFINTITGAEAPIGENLTNGVTMAIEDLKKKGIEVDLTKETIPQPENPGGGKRHGDNVAGEWRCQSGRQIQGAVADSVAVKEDITVRGTSTPTPGR
jgi:hypothetical protein